jgi:hypothetical protein
LVSFISTFWKWPYGGAALALFFFLIAPTITQASCGDYVTKAGQKGVMKNHQDQNDSVPSRPCSGPNCSRGPVKQPLTNSPLPKSTQQDTGLLAPSERIPAFSPTYLLSDEHCSLPTPPKDGVFHPPRIFFQA